MHGAAACSFFASCFSTDKLFISLGVLPFTAGKPAVITISNKDTGGLVGTDAVQLIEAR